VCADDRRFFGLVTSREHPEGGEAAASSCHVFMAEPVAEEAERTKRAAAFQLDTLTPGPDGHCMEFPQDADPILR
jgi:hypothetical protein